MFSLHHMEVWTLVSDFSILILVFFVSLIIWIVCCFLEEICKFFFLPIILPFIQFETKKTLQEKRRTLKMFVIGLVSLGVFVGDLSFFWPSDAPVIVSRLCYVGFICYVSATILAHNRYGEGYFGVNERIPPRTFRVLQIL